MSQKSKILEILSDNRWHCVNEFIDTYCVDYRRRLKDIKDRGYVLEGVKCTLHNHIGGSKAWRIVGYPVFNRFAPEKTQAIPKAIDPYPEIRPRANKEQTVLFSLPQTLHNLRA